MSKKLTAKEFQSLLNLMMASDPYPAGKKGERKLVQLLNDEARARDYDNWHEAYGEFRVDG